MTTKSRISIIGLAQVVAIINTSLSIFTIFDGANRYLELFSHFKIQYLITSVICFLIFLLYKNYKSAVVMALVFFINVAFVLPWYISPDNNHLESNSDHKLKILQSNVHTANTDYQSFINFVRSESPELIVVQEVNRKWLKNLSSLKNDYPYVKEESREDNFGIAIFSKIPFDESTTISIGESGLPSLKILFTYSGRQITLISTHPLPPISNEYFLSRNKQLQDIAQLSSNITTPLISVGDLNISMWSNNYKSLESTSHLTNARKGFGVLPSWPTMLPLLWIPIDHCLISKDFIVDSIKTGKDIGSDHYPLVINLRLRNDGSDR